jgi:tetratricopeptide (TPR) repeat protein
VLPTLAQSQDTRKAQAEQLREEGEFKLTFVNEPQNALQPLQQALVIYREIGDRQNEQRTLYFLGQAYFLLGNSSQAISYFQQSLTLYKELNGSLEKQDSIQKSIFAQRLEMLGHAYLRQGNYREALNYYQQELALTSAQVEPNSQDLTNLGNAYYFLGDYTKAIDYYQQSLPREPQPVSTSDLLTNLGAAFFASGNFVEAEKMLLAAIKQFEIDRITLNSDNEYSVEIFDSQSRPYNLLQQVLIAQNRPKEALEIAERGQARIFLDLLTTRSSPQAEAQLTSDSPTIAQIQKIAKQQNATIVKYSISYNDKSSYAGIWKLSQEIKLFVWVIKANGEINFRQVAINPQQPQQSSRLISSLQNFWQERIEPLGFPLVIAILIIIISLSIRLMFWRKRLGIALTFVAAS